MKENIIPQKYLTEVFRSLLARLLDLLGLNQNHYHLNQQTVNKEIKRCLLQVITIRIL